jgi:hypothetical protein
MLKIFTVIGMVGIGWILGYAHAHYVVAAECERLGGFFVGEQVYKCHAIEKREVSDAED